MGCHAVYGSLVISSLLLALAYIVAVFAAKEKKGMKSLGQILTWVIVLVVVAILLGSAFGPKMGCLNCNGKAGMPMMDLKFKK